MTWEADNTQKDEDYYKILLKGVVQERKMVPIKIRWHPTNPIREENGIVECKQPRTKNRKEEEARHEKKQQGACDAACEGTCMATAREALGGIGVVKYMRKERGSAQTERRRSGRTTRREINEEVSFKIWQVQCHGENAAR